MIFKQLAVSVLNRVLGKYIKDLDVSNLELAILSGQAVLKNLELREDALNEFDLPVEVTQGYIGEISLTIPWTNLYAAPCYICVEDVYLIAVPVKEKLYDAEKARASEVSAKRRRLNQIAENAKKSESSKDSVDTSTEDTSDSFVEKLVAQVVKNLKVSVKNIHFRYEDKVTCPEQPFACGFTLQNLSAETTSDEWEPIVIDSNTTTIYKLASLDNLSVYWNTKLSDSNLFSGRWNWKNFMEDGISTKTNSPRYYEFILHPLSAECHVILDQSTEIEMDIPKLLVEVIQQALALTLSQKQFHNLMELLDSFELMMINQKYKKFQPTVDVLGNSKSWWKYAYTAICEEKIRCWSWSRIREHRTRYRTYKDLFKKKLQGFYYESERERTLKHLQVLEDDLDIPSILIARQQAEIEVPPEKRHKKEREEPSSQGGWWSWLGMETAYVEEPLNINSDESIMSKLTVASLPVEEKEKLYKAINYSESTAPVKYAVEYIKRRVTFNLDSCVLTLIDETKQKIAQISTVGFAAALEQRPGGDAFMFRFEVNYFQVDGTSNNESERPCLVSSQNQPQSSSSPLLSFSAETNPLDVKADYSVKLKIEPIEVNYDNLTVDKVIEFFDVPNKSKLYEMEAAAANKLKELQSWTRAGLEYAITQHKVTYIAVDIRSPLVIVPEYGNLKSKGNLLIVDLGHLTVVSDLVNRESTLKLASDEELAKMFYDKFDVKITNVQMLIADQESDWRKTQQLEASPDHILPSTGLELQAFKSISAEYPELPQFKTTAVIPKIWFKFSDTKCKELLRFLDHFPFGKAVDPTKGSGDGTEKIDKEWARTASTLSLEEANSIQVLCRDTFLSKTDDKKGEDEDVWFDSVEHLPRRESSDSKAPDLIQLVGEFLIHQLLVTIDKADSLIEKPYICLEIKNLSTKVMVSTWHIKILTTLGFIELLDNHFHDADGLPLCVLGSKPKHEWISITYIKADPKGPEFLTSFNNTEQYIKVVFTSIELTAMKEALASFQLFILGLLESVSSEAGPPVNTKKPAPLETIEEDEPLVVRPLSPVQHSAKVISIEAEIEDVSVTLIANEQNVGQINVSGLNVDINMCGSETKIRTMLKDLSVLNATEGTLYPKILCLQDNTVFDCEITLFDNKRRPSDPLALDVAVDLRIGQFNFVYLSGFTAHIQNFIQALISPETVAYAQNLTQQVIKSQAQSIQESGSKIGLKIAVSAPTVQIPGHSFSKDMLVAVLGKLDITNAIGKSKDGVLMDYMDVSLNSFSVHCLSEGKKLSTDYLIEPIKLDVTVKRTLQHTQSHLLPLIEVDAVLPLLQLNIAVPDYKLLMTVINKNLSEGSQELDKASTISLQPRDSKSTISDEVMDGIRHRLGSVFEEKMKSVSAHPPDDQISLKCNVSVNKVVVFSPIIVNNESRPYLVLTVEKLLSTVTLDTWTININAELGTLELLDSINTDKGSDQPVTILSSSKAEDLISLEYKMVNPDCPDFESTYCSVEQRADFKFRRLNIICSQKSAICLQEHVLALTASDDIESSEKISEASSESSVAKKTASFKLGAIICEVDVLLIMDDKPLTNVSFKGLTMDILMCDGGIVIKSTQRGLSVFDLNSETYYPEIVSVQNENVFDFEYKSLNHGEVYPMGSDDESLDPDSSLVMNIGRIKVVFLYKFINDLMRYVEPLTSPQSTKYVQETAQKTVYSQIESIQTQGSRISLSIAINAPLVVIPRHSSSVDMMIADLGHLELQNEFQLFELDLSREKVVFDLMELSLQSVQLARGKMDLSNSSVIKRYLIEPIKMDANIRRSLKSSCHELPVIDAHCTLDFIKMNLGSKDYELLTTIMQENLNEGQTQTSQENITVDAAGIDQEGTAIATDEDYSEDSISIESTSSQEAYEYLEFTFDLPGVSLTLYKNEKDLDPFDSQSLFYEPNTKLCLTELDETTIHIAIPTDNSIHIRGILHGLVVEDARPDTSSAFPRLVDKKMQPYAEVLMSSAEEMCEFIYRQQTNGDMDILFQLQHATIFVNFPFIWPLLEFFTTPASMVTKKDVFVTPVESQTSLDGFFEDRDAIELHSEQLPATAPSETAPLQYKITVCGTIKDPDIVLLANPLSKESEALILNTELEFQYTMNKEDQRLLSNIHNLQMVSCQYPNVKQTSFLVLEPCDLTFKYKTPLQDQKGQGIDVDVDTMRLRFSPFLYKILNDVLLTLTGQEKVTEGVQTEGNIIVNPPDDLWDPKPITADSWNKSSAEASQEKIVVRQSTGDKIVLNTKEVQLVVVNEVHGAQVPFVMINTKIKANALDYTAQMKLEADLSVEISYYNEHLNAWEPLVEPIEEDQDNPQWELQVKIFFADGYVSSFTPRDQESLDGPPQDLTDGPDAHRWIPWQSRPRSESRKNLTSKRSSTGKEKMKSFKKSKRHARQEGVSQDEEDLDYNGALEQFVFSSTKLVGEVSEDMVDGATCPSDDGFSQNESKPQATYVVINSHDNIQLTVTPTALDVLSHISEAFASTTEHVMRSIPGPMFSICNKLGVHCTVTVEHDEKIHDMHDEVLTIKHRQPKLERDMSLSNMFANIAASLIADKRKKKKKKKKKRLFSEPLLGRFRQKFLKIQRRRAMSLPLALEGKTSKVKKKTSFQIGDSSVPNRPKLRKTVSCGVQKVTGAAMEMQGCFSMTKSLEETTIGDQEDDQGHSWRTRLRNRKNELFALVKHEEEDETDFVDNDQEDSSTRDSQKDVQDSSSQICMGCVDSKLAIAIGNIGAFCGGLSSPTFSEDEVEQPEGTCEDSVDGSRAEEVETYISFQVDGYYEIDYVPILRSGCYLYKLEPCIGDEFNVNTLVVVQIDTKNGQKTVTLRSPLQVHNHLKLSVDVLTYDESKIGAKNPFIHLLTVEPDSLTNIPMTVAYGKDLYLRPCHPRCGVSQDPLSWRNFSKEDIVIEFPQTTIVESAEFEHPVKLLDSNKPLQIKAHFQVDSLNKTPSKDVPHHVIHLHPPITLHNLLPVNISRLSMVIDSSETQHEEVIRPGEKVTIMTESVEKSCQLKIKLNDYKEEDWFGTLTIDNTTGKTTELHVTNSTDPNNPLVLGVLIMRSGTTDVTIYSPYWLINKSQLPLEYRVSKTHQMFYQTAAEDQALLFSFPPKSNRKVRMRVTDASWSSHISLDVVGDSGLVSCYNSKKARKFEFVLQIVMSQTGLTKIVTLTPKYVLINKAEFSLSVCEDDIAAPFWHAVEPSEVKPFWPVSSTKQLLTKPTLSSFVSKAFPYNYSHTSVLRMVEPKAICVEVNGDLEGSVTTILFTPYTPGVGTIRIENLCDNVTLRFLQEKTCHVTVLQPQFSILYTWNDPTKHRKLYWKPYLGMDNALEVPIHKDDYGKIQLEISEEGPDVKEDRKLLEDSSISCVSCSPSCIPSRHPPSDNDESGFDEVDRVVMFRRRSSKRYKKTIYWVSLLDGLQRVLLFTEDGKLASKARKSSECEPVSFELFVSLDGVGLSLMNSRPEEVANITLSSSTSVWQVEKTPGHWKTLGIELSTWLEDAWKNGQEQLNMDDTATVDFSRMEMIAPYKGSLRRSFEPALWFHYCSSQHYQSVHSKMHRIQIDNQLYGTVFPVALYPAPLPVGVALRDGPKPFIEMSVIYHQVPGQGVHHFKYAKVLIQEMNVKLDKSFIVALTSLFSKPPELYDEEVLFKMDTESYQVQLNETMAVKAALQTKRVFLEYFHLSPLKINLSFSLLSDVDEDDDQAFAADIMDFFVDSIGATLVDMNDAQLKLAFFERIGAFITQENLQSQITTHYTMQGVRQFYALVLGLDVLGNPYALISGIGEGVKDLFYEPYQGIIYGPQEFAQGLARGVKSLLGHVVGGTAGAFSRITGTIGQAVATLSFDTDYRLKRRQRMYIEPSGIGQGLMMGGKSLVMGLVFGIGGIVMKPIEGARTEGVEGFFKGIGKGLLGLLARPTGGVIDMVSFTLDGIRRSAEQGGEDIAHRMRLPRFAAPNEPLKPYSKQEATGFGILKGLPRALELSRDVYESHFPVSEDGSLVLLTNKRIIMLDQSRFWREFKVDWMCPYEEVTSTPFIAVNSLVIKYQKSSDDDITTNVYEIQSDDQDRLKDLRAKIIGLLRRFK